ncbi:MAG: YdcH family protein [Pseudomonadota bacterium]
MSQHTPNELTTIFRRDRELITQLKQEDRHFARLADEYHEVNREVHRIECETEAASDERTETLKKQRLALLDQITTIVTNAREAAQTA